MLSIFLFYNQLLVKDGVMNLKLKRASIRRRALALGIGAIMALGIVVPSAFATEQLDLIALDPTPDADILSSSLEEADAADDIEVVEDPGYISDDEELIDIGALQDSEESDAYINEELLDIDNGDDAFNELLGDQSVDEEPSTKDEPIGQETSTRSNASRTVAHADTGEATPLFVAALMVLLAAGGTFTFVRTRKQQ